MTKNTARVLQGYIALSPTEQQEFITELNAYVSAPAPKKVTLSESVKKTAIHLGPLNSGVCGCCGK